VDILNFISWIKGKRVVTTVDPDRTLLPVGLKDGRRDDEYLAGAISVANFITQLGPGQIGPQGPQGVQGPQGIQGNQGIQGIQGNTGAQGTAGNSITLLGSYVDLAAFNAGAGSLPGANIGDAWILLSDGSLMSWNGTVWFDAGDIKGPQGDQGPQGIQGIQGIQGLQGVQGIQGIQGVSGTSGLETYVRYSPIFQATGMTFTGSGATYPTYNSYYIKSGLLVSFVIEIDFTTVTNFGTGQYKVELPFAPAFAYNHFSGWIWADPNISPDVGTGHTILNADTSGITTVLDLHYLKQSGGANSPIREGLWIQGTPVTLTTISKAYVNGTYIALT
jgi:hypothetical protein